MKEKSDEVLKKRILLPISRDLGKVEEDLSKLVMAQESLLYQISYDLLNAGGKRLRPALVLLCGRFFQYRLEKVLPVALAMELVHMATLLHDDIIDESEKRRGQKTVNHRYGEKVAVLNGDLLFAHAIRFLSQIPDRSILQEMMEVICAMCEGEMDEVASNGHTNLQISQYLSRIEKKTALLFSKSCEFGARVCGATLEESKKMGQFGINLGLAFQIMDDVKDLICQEEDLGRPPGEDLRQKTMTLPLILAFQLTSAKEGILEVMKSKKPNEDLVKKVLITIQKSEALSQTLAIAQEFKEKSIYQLKSLPPIPEKRCLELLAHFVIDGQIRSNGNERTY